MNMDLGAISARAGAPNDGLKKGPDDNTRVPASASEVALWSKQNSDATGMRYQWGRKDPFTFATSSEHWGGNADQSGKYPVKLYNGSSVLIYQVDNGGNNRGKLPSGGVLVSGTAASSMSELITNPITLYGNVNIGAVIDQVGQSGDLYNYYLTSYSRGTDGEGHWGNASVNKPNVHNLYLDSYIALRHKSIYDPCPYGYRIPSNGTYNEFTNTGWTWNSYSGGTVWNQCWFVASANQINGYTYAGASINLFTSTIVSNTSGYSYWHVNAVSMRNTWSSRAYGVSVRCIEECELLPDATEASAGY